MTPRKAGVLAGQLPAGARVWASCGFDSAWTLAEHLMASQFDALQIANWQRTDGKSPQPKPMPRPGEVKQKAEAVDRMAARAAAFAQRQQTPTPRRRDARGRFVKEA